MFLCNLKTANTAKQYCCCLSEEARLQRKINKRIEHQLRQEKRDSRKNIKLLLLGTGESGKSTFIRQMKIIHEHGYESIEERLEYIRKIHQNIVTVVYTICHAMDMLNIDYEHSHNLLQVEQILKESTNFDYVQSWRQKFTETPFNMASETGSHSPCTPHIICLQYYQTIVQIIQNLSTFYLNSLCQFWTDSGVQKCVLRRNEYNLMDSAAYYMSRLNEILSDNYIPSVQDILHVRIPTNGINEYTFQLETINFLVVDVGGQRTERRKWIHCFENVTSIIFIVALSEFDQVLSEPMFQNCSSWRQGLDSRPSSGQSSPNLSVNRLEESKALFKTIVTSQWFRSSSVILFLNKYDVFEDKILHGPSQLGDYFDAFDVPTRDPINSAEFILDMFYLLEPSVFKKRVIYSHFTCATDTKNIKIVFQAVKDTILEQMLCKEIQIF